MYVSWSTSELRVRLARSKTGLSPPVIYFTDRSKAVLLLWIFDVFFFSVVRLLCLCVLLFICALWSPAGKGLTSWLSLVVSNCEFVTFPLVSWVKYGTWLYRFLIFAPLLTLIVYCDDTLSYDVASGSEITPCNKIDKPLVVYRFTGNVMTSITTLRT